TGQETCALVRGDWQPTLFPYFPSPPAARFSLPEPPLPSFTVSGMPDNRRSRAITQGVQRSPNRAMLRAVGFGEGDFEKPILGVANRFSTIRPSNAGLQVAT